MIVKRWRGHVPAFLLVAGLPAGAQAYGGPGLGIGAAATAFGVVGALVLAFAFLLWHPAKSLFRRIRKAFMRGRGD